MCTFRAATKQEAGDADQQCRERQICDCRENKKKFRHASGGLPNRNAFVFQSLLQFTGLKHFAHDVATADKFALHV